MSCPCWSLGGYAVFQVDMQFSIADMQLFAVHMLFFAIVLPLTWKVHHVTGGFCKQSKNCISAAKVAYPLQKTAFLPKRTAYPLKITMPY